MCLLMNTCVILVVLTLLTDIQNHILTIYNIICLLNTTALCPQGPSHPLSAPCCPNSCSSKQFSCWSGECVSLGKRCDLRRDCADGSDESDCCESRNTSQMSICELISGHWEVCLCPAVDCILSPWTSWSQCSVSCGLGSLYRQRNILRDARPGGSCGGAQFDSRACFLQACPGTDLTLIMRST